MAVRCQFEGNNEIGVFAKLTNKYCIVAVGGSENFYSIFETELAEAIPVVHATIADCRIVGNMCVGNKNGLIVPASTTDQELQHIRNCLPDEVVVKRIHEKLNALGNNFSVNDHMALAHHDIDKETEEIVADTLGVEVFRQTVASESIVGSYSLFTNQGGLVHPKTSIESLDELSSLLQVPLVAGTVNRGSESIGSGIIANDWIAFVGADTTSAEIAVIENVFKIGDGANQTNITGVMRESIVDTWM